MKIVVAGGAGFIGSHLCDRLIEEGNDVACLDNYVTGRPGNVRHLLGSPQFRLVECDVIGGVPDIGPVERIYHLASPASPPGYQRSPLETMRVNSEGTHNLLVLAEQWGARFLYASTSEAYGDPLEHPQKESYRGNVSTTGPRSMYDEAKRYGEALTGVFHKRGVDVRIVRIFNTYGPRSDPKDGRLVPNFVLQSLLGEPITVYGSGQQTRSLCYVSDLVDGLVRTMETEAAAGEVINLGNPDEHTIFEFAQIIRDLTRSQSDVVFTDFAVGDDPQRRQPDITKARGLLGWEPEVGLTDGLQKTIEYFRQEMAFQKAYV